MSRVWEHSITTHIEHEQVAKVACALQAAIFQMVAYFAVSGEIRLGPMVFIVILS